MSEEPEVIEEASEKKKKGKLPLLLILVLVIGGGGYFGLKMKGGGAKKSEKPKVELGVIEPLPEFVVNLKGGRSYLRAEVALHFRKDFKKDALAPILPAVRDKIISILTSKSIQEITTTGGKIKLRQEIAEDVNKVLNELIPPEGKKDKHDKKDGKSGSHNPSEPPGSDKVENPEWDSQEGPVLKVYFTSFATQ